MRFSIFIAPAFAALALAAPTPDSQKRSLLTDLTGLIGQVENGLGVTALEDGLDSLLGGSISKLEEKLGVTFAEKLLGLSEKGASPGDLQSIGKAVFYLERGLGIEDVDKLLDTLTGGAVTSLEDALGVTDLEDALGISE